MLATESPIPQYYDVNGDPLDGGYLYFGTENLNPETSVITVYWDFAGTQPAAQPIRTINGFASRGGIAAQVYSSVNYSLTIKDSHGALVLYAPTSAEFSNASIQQGDVAEIIDNITDPADPDKGAGYIPFNYALDYVQGTMGGAVQDEVLNLMWLVPTEAERAAIKAYTSTADHTSLFNTALALGRKVYFPEGLWNADTDTGILLRAGSHLMGGGMMRTIIKAAAKGGTSAELINYVKGSVIKRAYTPGVANAYVTGCDLSDFSVQLNFPAFDPSNYNQIGIDLRNITRSKISRVHVGNYGIPGQPICPAPASADAVQGYGIVCGTQSGSAIDYCGGEENRIQDVFVWGAYSAILIDDDTLCPLSASHGTIVDNADIQGAHEQCVHRQQYAAGVIMSNLTIQYCIRQSGSAAPTIGTCIGGYGGLIHVKYGELGEQCDVVHEFLNGSSNNRYVPDYVAFSGASVGDVLDNGAAGSRNYLKYASFVSGNPTGPFIEKYNKALLRGTWKGHWNGTAFVVDAANGITVTRNGAGDYFLNVDTAQPNDDWIPRAQSEPDSSFHFGGVVFQFSTQTTTRIRMYCYTQVAGVTTVADPTKLYLSFEQAV